MKIKYKLIAAASAVILSAMAINRKIFISAEKKLLQKKNKSAVSEHIYNWKFGKINYKTIGEGEPLLLIHSLFFGASEREWENNISELSKNNKVYIINLLGYGDSERAAITYSSYLYVCLINDFITEVIKKPAMVIASNTSGAISAMSYIFNPNNFKKLCLVNPPVFEKKAAVSEILKKIPLDLPILGDIFFNYYNSRKNIKKYLENELYFNKKLITKEKINNLYAYSHKGKSANRYLFSSFMTNRFEIGAETSLPEIDIPILIIYGKEYNNLDNNITAIKALNKSAEVKLLNGKAFPNEEDSNYFNYIVMDFFK